MILQTTTGENCLKELHSIMLNDILTLTSRYSSSHHSGWQNDCGKHLNIFEQKGFICNVTWPGSSSLRHQKLALPKHANLVITTIMCCVTEVCR